jgi:hypothetical protein
MEPAAAPSVQVDEVIQRRLQRAREMLCSGFTFCSEWHPRRKLEKNALRGCDVEPAAER